MPRFSCGVQEKRITRRFVIRNKSGLHARPAAQFVRTASSFKGTRVTVTAVFSGRSADARSIVQVLAMGASPGQEIEVAADGPEAQKCIDAVAELIEKTLPATDV